MRANAVPDTKPHTCRQAAERATEFLDGRMAADAHARLARHLDACSACRTYVEQIALTRDSLRKLPGASMPERMRKALHKRLAKRAARAKASDEPR